MTYQMRAYLYIKAMFGYVNNWCNWDDVMEATEKTFLHTGKHASVEVGSSRIVVVGKDFVIKWDYDKNVIQDIGGCEDEFIMYKKSLSSGYSYLLAPVFRITYRNRYFYIMPRVHNIGRFAHTNKSLTDFLNQNEITWIKNNIGDLHSWNWGLSLENNKPIIIDYACRPTV